MTPVKQNVLFVKDGIGNGNCLAASLASLLDLPLWMVPPFEQMFGRGEWRRRVDQWLGRMFGLEMARTDGHKPDGLPEFYIASGLSPRGVAHAVIYRRGEIAHDPHPSDAGIASVEYTWHLRPVSSSAV